MPKRVSSGPFPMWDDYRYFLATSEAGSFSKAACDLGVAQSTLSRRIEHLEQQFGIQLFARLSTKGVILTPEGESILDMARELEAKILQIQGSLLGLDKRMEGTVRISVTDGLATYWLTPNLSLLRERYPGISIELQCSIDPIDVHTMKTDLSIRSGMPEAADLIVVKLGKVHFVPWASPDYLARNGAPMSLEELEQHSLLDHSICHLDVGNWDDWRRTAGAAKLVTYKTNSSASMIRAVQSGIGIGMLPTYMVECVNGIVPLSLDLRTYSDIFLNFHPMAKGTERVRAVIDWLKALFDAKKAPWFGDEFHPPAVPK